VRIASGRVEAVVTDKGAIETPVVVDAAGAWTRQVAAASGIHIPLAPTMQQLM
jgi:glycine/D-amino acid oxidase-like deaminating enzyme